MKKRETIYRPSDAYANLFKQKRYDMIGAPLYCRIAGNALVIHLKSSRYALALPFSPRSISLSLLFFDAAGGWGFGRSCAAIQGVGGN